MSDTKYAPGPYRVEVDEDHGIVTVRATVPGVGFLRDEALIFEMAWDETHEGDRERWIATANLIAAAPELFEALVDVADLMEQRGQNVRSDGSPSPAYDRALAAISKAKGES